MISKRFKNLFKKVVCACACVGLGISSMFISSNAQTIGTVKTTIYGLNDYGSSPYSYGNCDYYIKAFGTSETTSGDFSRSGTIYYDSTSSYQIVDLSTIYAQLDNGGYADYWFADLTENNGVYLLFGNSYLQSLGQLVLNFPYYAQADNTETVEYSFKIDIYQDSVTPLNISNYTPLFTYEFNTNSPQLDITNCSLFDNQTSFRTIRIYDMGVRFYEDPIKNLIYMSNNSSVLSTELITRIETLQSQIEYYQGLYESGLISIEEYETTISNLQSQLSELQEDYDNAISETYSWERLVFGVCNTPMYILSNLFGFELFGTTFFKVFIGILTLLILVWLIRKFF